MRNYVAYNRFYSASLIFTSVTFLARGQPLHERFHSYLQEDE